MAIRGHTLSCNAKAFLLMVSFFKRPLFTSLPLPTCVWLSAIFTFCSGEPNNGEAASRLCAFWCSSPTEVLFAATPTLLSTPTKISHQSLGWYKNEERESIQEIYRCIRMRRSGKFESAGYLEKQASLNRKGWVISHKNWKRFIVHKQKHCPQTDNWIV